MSTWRLPLWYDRLAGTAWRAVVVVAAVLLLITAVAAGVWASVRAVADQWDGILVLIVDGRASVVETATAARIATTILPGCLVAFFLFGDGAVSRRRIQGRAVRLHPLDIAPAVIAGSASAGFVGGFLAVPVTAAGFVVLAELRQAGHVVEGGR